MPVAARGDVTTSDDDLEDRVVTETTGISTDMHLDVQRLPNAVVDNACPNFSEVLLLAVGVSARCDQLEVVGVNALGDRYVRVDKRPQAKLFDPNEFRVLWNHRGELCERAGMSLDRGATTSLEKGQEAPGLG